MITVVCGYTAAVAVAQYCVRSEVKCSGVQGWCCAQPWELNPR